SLVVDGDDSTITMTAGAGRSNTLSFTSFAASPSARLNFQALGLGSTTKVTLGSQPAGFLGGGVTVNEADFAVYDPSVGVRAMAVGSGISDYATSVVAGRHVKLTGTTAAPNGSISIPTLNLDGSTAAVQLVQADNTMLSIASGAIVKG